MRTPVAASEYEAYESLALSEFDYDCRRSQEPGSERYGWRSRTASDASLPEKCGRGLRGGGAS